MKNSFTLPRLFHIKVIERGMEIVVDDAAIVSELESALKKSGVRILKGNYGGKGGVAALKGETVIALDRGLPDNVRRSILAEALCQLDWCSLELSADLKTILKQTNDPATNPKSIVNETSDKKAPNL